MNILLVQVPTSHLGSKERVYPLGLSRLASLIPDNIETSGLDMNLHADPWPLLKERLKSLKPDIIALSFRNLDPLAGHHASYLSSLKTSAALVRKLRPDARILAGGPAFSLFGKRLMQEIPQIDFGLVGEGEAVFERLIFPALNPGDIPGLIFRKDGKLIQNATGPHLDMATLPDPDIHLFPISDYTRGNQYVAAIGIEGKRGCNLQCGYCVYPSLGGCRMRLRPPALIVDEMQQLHHDHGVDLFHFTDSVVNLPASHFEAVCREIIRRGLMIGWTGFFRETHVTPDLIDLAVKAGLVAIYFSGDALTDYGLTLLNKQMTKADILKASRMTADNGILTMCHFMANLPGETKAHAAEAVETLNRILEIHAHSSTPGGNLGAVIFNTIRLYPDAPLTRKLLTSGELDPAVDLLYPVYHNPPQTAHRLHQLEAYCHAAGVFSRLQIKKIPEGDAS
jgi:putative variant cofactor biosynthesis B12-binding/radical SAM domain protein 1